MYHNLTINNFTRIYRTKSVRFNIRLFGLHHKDRISICTCIDVIHITKQQITRPEANRIYTVHICSLIIINRGQVITKAHTGMKGNDFGTKSERLSYKLCYCPPKYARHNRITYIGTYNGSLCRGRLIRYIFLQYAVFECDRNATDYFELIGLAYRTIG